MMKNLWAPWRADYLTASPSSCKNYCLFCTLKKTKNDEETLILHRDKKSFVVMNRFPYNNGHLMVAPLRHTASIESLKPEEAAELFRLIQRCVQVLKKEYRPQGFNIGANLGSVAGAGVTGHLHFHIVPRWQGDTNFMPLLGETKVINEHLQKTYERLSRYFGG